MGFDSSILLDIVVKDSYDMFKIYQSPKLCTDYNISKKIFTNMTVDNIKIDIGSFAYPQISFNANNRTLFFRLDGSNQLASTDYINFIMSSNSFNLMNKYSYNIFERIAEFFSNNYNLVSSYSNDRIVLYDIKNDIINF